MLLIFVLLGLVTHSLSGGSSPSKCQPQEHQCGKYEEYVVDSNSCIVTCANRDTVNSPYAGACKPHTGCDCISGYMRLNDDATGPCVKENKCPMKPCPPKCGVNEIYKQERTKCPPQSCKRRYIKYRCAPTQPEPGCDCIEGYLRNDNGTCIPECQCPPVPELPQCGDYEVATNDRIVCPPQTCQSKYALYKCDANREPEPGCDCIKGYLRNSKGVCIPSEDCPGPNPEPECGENEIATDDRIICPPQSCAILYTSYLCVEQQDPEPGCNCIDGYLRNSTGHCIPTDQCPPGPEPICGENEVATDDRIICPPQTCESIYSTYQVCEKRDPEPGCNCIDGYLRDSNGKCIPSDQCQIPGGNPGTPEKPPSSSTSSSQSSASASSSSSSTSSSSSASSSSSSSSSTSASSASSSASASASSKSGTKGCNGDPNATFKKHPNPCQPTCDNRDPTGPCTKPCNNSGCECNKGYVLYKNTCILPKNCPAKGCNGDPNATFKKHPNPCQPTCDNRDPTGPCTKPCDKSGCECNKGYVLYKNTCILPKNCPAKGCNGDPNATFKKHPNPCQPTCDNRDPTGPCTKPCDKSGCECNKGYVLYKNTCILPKNCPVKCDPNATFKKCPNPCPPTCDNPNPTGPCTKACVASGCECNKGYLKYNNTCVLPKNCPVKCDPNATYKKCPNPCPPTCDNPNSTGPCTKACVAGCECNKGYLKYNNTCVLPKDCPGTQCGANEQFVNCKINCPNNYCPVNDFRAILICDPPHPCPSGCACISGYLRKSTKEPKCIEASQCPPVNCTRPNEVWNPSPPNCLRERCSDVNKASEPCDLPYRNFKPVCVCRNGFYRNDSDICVPANECPYTCPISLWCRPTCANPNPKNCPDVQPSDTNIDGCQCQPGYILDKADGKCIRIEECPRNQSCNGDPHAVIQSRRWPCRATCDQPNTSNCSKESVYYGCECEDGYILDKEDGKCIKVEECPAGDPCAPNATFSTFINSCPYQYCKRENSMVMYPCDPIWPSPAGCACKSDYLRLYDGSDRCVLSSDCPPICPVYEECRPTCSVPRPMGIHGFCPEVQPATTNVDGCQCQEGYILEYSGGKCIKIEECPQNQGCNGDLHAIVKKCPSSCPPTCDNPNNKCVNKKCSPPDCQCAPGYILSAENGRCILASECQGGDPCGPNATYVDCSYRCPENYCPENDDLYPPVCDPIHPCPPGCMCKLNHKRLSYDDERCIMSSDCPPVNCTRQNEVWSPCPSACLRERCEDLNDQPSVCYTLVLNCEPRCVCADGYYRNSTTDLCIPAKECVANNPCLSPCTPTCADPNPTCDNPPAQSCCEEGYILSEKNGKCIRIDECPKGCNGDPNAVVKECSDPCPPSCDSPESKPCRRACPALGCECAKGYLQSEPGGKCIEASQCPGGDPCGPNGTFVSCTFRCPDQNCPLTDSPFQVACSMPRYCRGGCACKFNHKRLNDEKGTCILSSDCPPVNCTRQNEVWSSCPSACLREYCEDLNDQPSVCNTLVYNCGPRCVCADGYYRNSTTDLCIPAKECVANNPCLSPCTPTCADPNPTCDNPPAQSCCQDGYILSEKNGKCIRIDECPKGCNGDPNAVAKECSDPCPPSCDSPESKPCKKACPALGCECARGYLQSKPGGKCIEASQCPGGDPCGPNGTFVGCAFRCPDQNCPRTDSRFQVACMPPRYCRGGCACKLNHKRLNDEKGTCILSSDCPPVNCTRPNEVWSLCPSACLKENCENVNDPPAVCNTLVLNCQPKCICQYGYYRNKSGICIPAKDCAGKTCPSKCTPSCTQPNPSGCSAPDNCCDDGYLYSEPDKKCVKVEDCPQNLGCNGDPNAIVKKCPAACPRSCDHPEPKPCPKLCLTVGCECAPRYVQSKSGKCILPDQCPGGDPCGPNATFVDCGFRCPNQYCPQDDSQVQVACKPGRDCPPGCGCKLNYSRLSYDDDRCILSSECPPVECTRPHEVWSPCASDCLSESCDKENEPLNCDTYDSTCKPKCICEDGYCRNSTGTCVPAKDGGKTCPSKCTPTCTQPNPSGCSAPDNCCDDGYLYSEPDKKCVKVEDCPRILGCNGDSNAIVKKCPAACPRSCDNPEPKICSKACLTVGCECAPSFVRSKSGKCIFPDECPGGDPCGPNATFVDCGFRCPNHYCPIDDSQEQVACKPGNDCSPGCSCKLNYKRLSYDDDRCVLSSECSPVKCTRPNEIWSSCPSGCVDENESCENVNNSPKNCDTYGHICKPKCICQDGYYRNSSGICVPANKCAGYNACQSKCAPTCANPTPPNCDVTENGCCASGNILSEPYGWCIKIEECPKDIGCNGDLNAFVKQCPDPCPSTCDSPNAFPCKKACLSVGCQCSPGYLKSTHDGTCIKPDNCPGGNPCGKNGTFVTCKNNCPSEYCPEDDSRVTAPCSTGQCLSGCSCRVNHKRKSRDDPSCIISSDCPPVKCTRQNEEWNPCPSACLQESCKDIGKKPVRCNTLLLDCHPRCVCTKDHYRNASGICVSPKQCGCGCQ